MKKEVAVIDAQGFENAEIGDVVGKCDGVVMMLDECGVKVEVKPSFHMCARCPLNEDCSVSACD